MKINQPDYDRLATLVKVVCSVPGGIDATFKMMSQKYAAPGRTASTVNAMIRWDIFHAACRIDKALMQHLYDYLNDNHIDTALKHITDTK